MVGGGKQKSQCTVCSEKDDDCGLRHVTRKSKEEGKFVGGKWMNNVGWIPINDGCF